MHRLRFQIRVSKAFHDGIARHRQLEHARSSGSSRQPDKSPVHTQPPKSQSPIPAFIEPVAEAAFPAVVPKVDEAASLAPGSADIPVVQDAPVIDFEADAAPNEPEQEATSANARRDCEPQAI